MSAITIRICFGVSLWAASLFGSLSLARLPVDWGHGVCGPWGCGPPIQSLVACHLAWLVVLAPPAVLVARSERLSNRVRRRIGMTLIVVALIGLLAVIVYQRAFWWEIAPSWQRGYFWHRCGFVVLTAIDLPLMQAMLVGTVLAVKNGRTKTRSH